MLGLVLFVGVTDPIRGVGGRRVVATDQCRGHAGTETHHGRDHDHRRGHQPRALLHRFPRSHRSLDPALTLGGPGRAAQETPVLLAASPGEMPPPSVWFCGRCRMWAVPADQQRRHVVLLAGPSGAGKSRLASRLGLPVLQLDDYYKDGDDPTLPRFESGAVDWDDARSWSLEAALAGIRELSTTGSTDAPVYDISANGRTGHRVVDARTSPCFVAEGIFAAELVTVRARPRTCWGQRSVYAVRGGSRSRSASHATCVSTGSLPVPAQARLVARATRTRDRGRAGGAGVHRNDAARGRGSRAAARRSAALKHRAAWVVTQAPEACRHERPFGAGPDVLGREVPAPRITLRGRDAAAVEVGHDAAQQDRRQSRAACRWPQKQVTAHIVGSASRR